MGRRRNWGGQSRRDKEESVSLPDRPTFSWTKTMWFISCRLKMGGTELHTFVYHFCMPYTVQIWRMSWWEFMTMIRDHKITRDIHRWQTWCCLPKDFGCISWEKVSQRNICTICGWSLLKLSFKNIMRCYYLDSIDLSSTLLWSCDASMQYNAMQQWRIYVELHYMIRYTALALSLLPSPNRFPNNRNLNRCFKLPIIIHIIRVICLTRICYDINVPLAWVIIIFYGTNVTLLEAKWGIRE